MKEGVFSFLKGDSPTNSFPLFFNGTYFETTVEYDEHYIFCGVCMADGTSRHFHALPRAEDVTITGGKTSSLSLPFPHENELNITWDAKGYGKFEFNTDECNACFHFEDNEDDGAFLDLRMKVVGREPWSRGNSLAGPEGWLYRCIVYRRV